MNHSESGVCVEEAPIQQVFSKEPNDDVAATADQVVVAVSVPTQASYQKKKRFIWSFSIDPDLPNFLIDDNNYQDELLIRCIIQESPWRVKHGAKKTSWESVMSLLADQQHQFEKVFEGASLITVQHRYEGYINLVKRWTSARDKHNQEEKSEDVEPNSVSLRTRKQKIKQGILDIYNNVQLFEEEIRNGKRANEEKEDLEKAAAEEIRQAAIGTYQYSIQAVLHELLHMIFC